MQRSIRRAVPRAVFAGVLALTLSGLAAWPALAVSGPGDAGRPGSAVGEAPRRGPCADAWRAAREDPTVDTLKALGLCEIDRRLETIDRLRGAVDGSRPLTDAHEEALREILDASASGLRALRAEIASDTSVPELREDLARIVEDYRIYVLVARQVRLVIAADVTDTAIDRATQLADRLEQAIERAEADGQDVGDARASLDSMRTHLATAADEVDGIADSVLPLTPADWNAGSAEPTLDAARDAIARAREELRAALVDARSIVAALRDRRG